MEYRINIVGEIGWEVTPSDIQPVLDAAKEGDTVYVSINSGGGYVFDGMAIYDALRLCKANIVTINTGMCASIASVIFMAGDTMISNPNAMFMVHQAWTTVQGNADALKKEAAELEAIDQQIQGVYQARKPEFFSNPNFTDLFKNEKLFTGKQALEYGMIDSLSYENKVSHQVQLVYNSLNPKKEMGYFDKFLGKKEQPKNAVSDAYLTDGTFIRIESESGFIEVGAKVVLEDGSNAPEGEHTLGDGTVFRLDANGIVTETMQPEDSADPKDAIIADLQAALAAKDSEISNLQTEGATVINGLNAELTAKNSLIAKMSAPKNLSKPQQGGGNPANNAPTNSIVNSFFSQGFKNAVTAPRN
jgi:ATP-dependent Clp protease protease subunit